MPLTRNAATSLLTAVLLFMGSTAASAATASDTQRDLFRQVYADVERGNWAVVDALNDDASDDGWRGSFTYVDQFLDDTVGIALGIAYAVDANDDGRITAAIKQWEGRSSFARTCSVAAAPSTTSIS